MWRIPVLTLIAAASAQIPSLGWCPDYQPMAYFNMRRFLGTWYESERYFTVSELGSRCVTTNYESTPEGRIVVSNEITNSLTGFKRLMEGSLQSVGREGEGRFMVKYSSLPLPYDFEYSILDTDYDNFAVMWSCSGIGPVHTQNTWILTRDRIPSAMVVQSAYAVLDKFKISRTFFVKTNQADCTVLPGPAADPVEPKEGKLEIEVSPPVEVEKEKVVAEVKASVPLEKSAAEPAEEPMKPMQVPELIMSESEKKEEVMTKKSEVKDIKKLEFLETKDPEKKETEKKEPEKKEPEKKEPEKKEPEKKDPEISLKNPVQ